ncbi:MAG: hypothetical protein M1840_006655 [Geoglossum simile]|nr:MAG: hypothetical protein M1840_006655 [Geoglossum simile]
MKALALLASLVSFLAAHAEFAPNPMLIQQDDATAYPFDFDKHGEPITNCTIDQRNDIITHHISYMELHNYVGNISAIYTQGIRAVLDESSGYPGARSSLKIYVGLDEVFSQDALFGNGTIEKTMHWGAYVQGARTSTVLVANNGSANGTIDGRGFWIKDNNTMIFLDGKGPPTLILPTNLKPLLSSFIERMASALQLCAANSTDPGMPSSAMPAHDGFEIALDRSQDTGHLSRTRSDTPCVLCIASWVAYWAAVDASCSSLSCWWSFGLGCVLCTLTSGAGLAVSILEAVKSASTAVVVFVARAIKHHVSERHVVRPAKLASRAGPRRVCAVPLRLYATASAARATSIPASQANVVLVDNVATNAATQIPISRSSGATALIPSEAFAALRARSKLALRESAVHRARSASTGFAVRLAAQPVVALVAAGDVAMENVCFISRTRTVSAEVFRGAHASITFQVGIARIAHAAVVHSRKLTVPNCWWTVEGSVRQDKPQRLMDFQSMTDDYGILCLSVFPSILATAYL